MTVEYETEAGTATPGADYVSQYGTVVIPAGASSVGVSIPILNDTTSEATDRFSVSLISVDSGSVLFPRTANVAILDDENPAADPAQPVLASRYPASVTDVVTGLTNPIALAWVPGQSSAFIAEKDGIIKFADMLDGTTSVVLDIRDSLNSAGDRGLLNIALHPDFADNHYLYAFLVPDPPGSESGVDGQAADGIGNRYARLVRYEVDMSGATPAIMPGSETVLLGAAGQSFSDISGEGLLNFTKPAYADYPSSAIDPVTGLYKQDYIKVDSMTHTGGGLAFGPDGALYVATGDGASFSYADPRTKDVQDIDSLSGKILRIDPITGEGLADNPFAEAGNLDSNRSKVWALGLRNPFSMTFADDGRMFISETGWSSWEEINLGGSGSNYGWPFFEGGDGGVLLQTHQYSEDPAAAAFYDKVASGEITVTAAFRAFSHVGSDPGYRMSAIVGTSHIYTGDKYPDVFANDYFFTDVVNGEIYTVDINDRTKTQFVMDLPVYGPVNFTQGPDGYLYLVDIIFGSVLRLEIENVPNEVPVANDDTWIVSANTYVKLDGSVLSANDTDGNGDPLTVTAVEAGGKAGLLDDGTVTFKTAVAGPGQFTYVVDDGWGGSDTAQVSVTAVTTSNAADVLTLNTPQNGASYINGFGGDDKLTGGAGRDWLLGDDGNDRLDGKTGADYMAGGKGDDLMLVGSSKDVVVEWAESGSGGTDTIITSVNYTLPLNVEILTMVNSAIKGIGNKQANTIVGNDVANQIDGKEGNDRLAGGKGDDTLTGGTGKDLFVFDGNAGHDLITDFLDKADLLDFRGSGLTFAGMVVSASGVDAIVSFGPNQIVIAGLAGKIGAADFVFV